MPSPGKSAIADIIGAKTYTVEGEFATQFNVDGTFVQKLSTALDSGWTSVSPSTTTSMATAFTSELDGYLSGQGKQFLDCVAAGIDQETADWVLSWNSETQIHGYTVTAASIVSHIKDCAPLWSSGAQAIAQVCADAFMSGFGQEAG